MGLKEPEGDKLLLKVEKAVVVTVDGAFVNGGAANAGRHVFESVNAGHFFDKVCGAFEVGSPTGNVPGAPVALAQAEASENGAGIFE